MNADKGEGVKKYFAETKPFRARRPHVEGRPLVLGRRLMFVHHARLDLSGNIATEGRLLQRDLLSLLQILWGRRTPAMDSKRVFIALNSLLDCQFAIQCHQRLP